MPWMTVRCSFWNDVKKVLQSGEIILTDGNTVVFFNNKLKIAYEHCCRDYWSTFCIFPVCFGSSGSLSMSFNKMQVEVSEVNMWLYDSSMYLNIEFELRECNMWFKNRTVVFYHNKILWKMYFWKDSCFQHSLMSASVCMNVYICSVYSKTLLLHFCGDHIKMA